MSLNRVLTVDPVKYSHFKVIQSANGTNYSEHLIGSRRSVVLNGKPIVTTVLERNLDIGNITNQKFGSFLGRFNKQLYKQFAVNPLLFDLQIEFRGLSRSKNKKMWELLPIGQYFYNIDLSSAYWQIAYKLGYIEAKMYYRYLKDDDYKKVKRYCISFLARKNIMKYSSGEIIECETSVLKTVYQNVRHELYTIVKNASELVSDCLEHNIDGVMILPSDINIIKQYFQSHDLLFKITECRKFKPNEFYFGHQVRKFKNR